MFVSVTTLTERKKKKKGAVEVLFSFSDCPEGNDTYYRDYG